MSLVKYRCFCRVKLTTGTGMVMSAHLERRQLAPHPFHTVVFHSYHQTDRTQRYHTMQPTRPKHHANSSRSLFQNPWIVAESTAAPPAGSSHPTPRNSNYWPLFPSGFQIPTLERVRASALATHPHPPVKVVKPDWGIRSTSTSTDSGPSLKATWLGHAVRHDAGYPIWVYADMLLAYIQSFIVEFPRVAAGPQGEPARVLFDPIFSECAGPSPWFGFRRRLPPPCTVAELPDFQFVVYSHNQCVLLPKNYPRRSHSKRNFKYTAMTTSTSPRCNRYMTCAVIMCIFSSH